MTHKQRWQKNIEEALMHSGTNEEYQALHRAFAELRSLATDLGKTAIIGDPKPRDVAKYFFIKAYHFKDWLKKDLRVTSPEMIEEHINRSKALSYAADLCNSFKHKELNKPPRSGETFDKINMAYTLAIPQGVPTAKIKMLENPVDGDTITISRVLTSRPRDTAIASAVMMVTLGGKQYDALTIATQCIADWKAFLQSANLQIPET